MIYLIIFVLVIGFVIFFGSKNRKHFVVPNGENIVYTDLLGSSKFPQEELFVTNKRVVLFSPISGNTSEILISKIESLNFSFGKLLIHGSGGRTLEINRRYKGNQVKQAIEQNY